MWLCKHLGRSGKSSHLRISVSALQFFVFHFRAPSWGAKRPGIDSQGVNGYDNDTPTVFNCWRPPVCCPVSKLEQRSGAAFFGFLAIQRDPKQSLYFGLLWFSIESR